MEGVECVYSTVIVFPFVSVHNYNFVSDFFQNTDICRRNIKRALNVTIYCVSN